MKTIIRSFFSASVLALFLTPIALFYMPESVKAEPIGGCWVGCGLPNSTWSPNDPGDMSGCSVQYTGLVPWVMYGTYEYTCNGQITTCLYDYNGYDCHLPQ